MMALKLKKFYQHADYAEDVPFRIRKLASLTLAHSIIRDGKSLWRGDRFLVGDVNEKDNLIDDRIPRSFIREGCGGWSGPHFANENISRAAALRGTDVPSFLPISAPGPGLVGSCGMEVGQYLAVNFEMSLRDFEAEVPDEKDEPQQADTGKENEEQDSYDEPSESDPQESNENDVFGTPKLPTQSARQRRSVFGAGMQEEADDSEEEEEDSEDRERARLRYTHTHTQSHTPSLTHSLSHSLSHTQTYTYYKTNTNIK